VVFSGGYWSGGSLAGAACSDCYSHPSFSNVHRLSLKQKKIV